MAKPRVLLAPHFRQMDEIFDRSSVERLHDLAEVVWGVNDPMPEDEFLAALADVDAVVFGTWNCGGDGIRRAGSRLQAVLEVAGGHSHPELDYEYLFGRAIPIGSCAPAFGPAVAEMALALTLAAARRVVESDRGFRTGTERYLHAGNDGAFSLHGKTVGFIGCGGLARSLQPLLGPFAVTILGYDPWIASDELASRGIRAVASLEEIMGAADVVFVLAVPTATNRGMVSGELMSRLRPSDVLVVISRAHVVDFDALAELLMEERFRAGIDVFPSEPLAPDHPIRGAGSAVLTAHLAGALPEALLEIGRMVVDDLESIFNGRPPVQMQYATPAQRRGLLGP
jgi:phosphoglycerate dehydrogenase-like enzyme